jgi:hypothetical protein
MKCRVAFPLGHVLTLDLVEEERMHTASLSSLSSSMVAVTHASTPQRLLIDAIRRRDRG